MKQFLLLRSNKQSGPYSAEELRQMGLKPYDLIWVEGKSAAWRYPGEVEDLKSFAPAVEEQPYDRFYKKPSESAQQPEETPADIPANAAASQPAPQPKPQPAPAKKPREYKRIFVTLPSGLAARAQEPPKQKISPPVNDELAQEEQPTYLSQQAQKQTDTYRPKEQRSRSRAIPAIALIAGMVALVALGIVIGMYINKKPELSQQQNTTALHSGAQIDAGNEVHYTNTPATEQQQAALPADTLLHEETSKPAPVIKQKKIAVTIDSPAQVVPEPQKVEKPAVTETATAKRPVEQPAPSLDKMVSVTNNDYQVGPFGGISKLALTLTNSSEYDLSLVVVQLEYLKVNKEVFKTENLYFRDVAPNSSVTVNAPRSGRGNTINYKVTLINSKDQIYHAGN